MGLFKEAPYKEATQNIIDVIGCNYKVFDTACTAGEVNRVYVEEIERGKKEGFIPVLVPCDDILDEWFHLEDEDKEKLKKETTNEKSRLLLMLLMIMGKNFYRNGIVQLLKILQKMKVR